MNLGLAPDELLRGRSYSVPARRCARRGSKRLGFRQGERDIYRGIPKPSRDDFEALEARLRDEAEEVVRIDDLTGTYEAARPGDQVTFFGRDPFGQQEPGFNAAAYEIVEWLRAAAARMRAETEPATLRMRELIGWPRPTRPPDS